MRVFIYTIALLLMSSIIIAQNSTIDKYVILGLENNLYLKEKNYDVELATALIQKAKSELLPSIQLLGRYSIASGGRDFLIPSGTLLNPISENLNELNSAVATINDQFNPPSTFISLEDESIRFLRQREHETKVRFTWPIFNDLLKHNIRRADLNSESKRVEEMAYKRLLVKEIKEAYLNHILSVSIMKSLRHEANRIQLVRTYTNRLFENGKSSKVELEQIELSLLNYEVSIEEAKMDSLNTLLVFNFLINREDLDPLEYNFDMNDIFFESNTDSLYISAMSNSAARQLGLIDMEITKEERSKTKKDWIPRLSLVGDIGLQGVDFGIARENRFAQLSLQLQWNLVDFGRKVEHEISDIKMKRNKARIFESDQKLRTKIYMAFQQWNVSDARVRLHKSALAQAQRIYDLELAKINKGLISIIDWEKAKNDLLNAELEMIKATHKNMMMQVQLEWMTGSYKFSGI